MLTNTIRQFITSVKMDNTNKVIYLGCDHGGFELKETIKKHLLDKNYKVEDVGAYTADRCDYPDYAAKVCEGVKKDEANNIGLVVCGSGIGISIAANKFKGIRCANCHDFYSALMSRKRDNCNVLSMGCRVIGEETAKIITDTFLQTPFENNDEAFNRRLEKIKEIEEKYLKS